jgi:AcrR family transcriptional regulator
MTMSESTDTGGRDRKAGWLEGPQPLENPDLWYDVASDSARRLLDAGVEEFALRGYHGTTTRNIASSAGMSPAALYIHFPSKAELLCRISTTGHADALRTVKVAGQFGETPVDRARSAIEAFVSWHALHHRVARVCQYELHSLEPACYKEVAGIRRRTEQAMRALIEDGITAGDFVVDDLQGAVLAVLALGIDVARWYPDESRWPPRRLGTIYGALALRMLRPS